MKIFLSKKLINGDLSDEAVMVYIALKKIDRKDESKYYVNINMLYYSLFGELNKTKNTRYIYEKLKNGLEELVNVGLISYVNEFSSKEFVLDLTKIYFETSKAKETQHYFIVIQDTEIHKIMNYNKAKVDVFKLCRYFVYLVGTFNSKTEIGFSSIEYMANQTGICETSIVNYTTSLEKMELIYVYRAPYIKRNSKDGSISGITNTYGRYSQKDKIENTGIDHTNNVKYDANEKIAKKAMSKITKSMSMKFNSFCNGKVYDDDTLKNIYESMLDLNKRNIKKYGQSDEHQKDLTVFKDYDFYVVEDSVETSSPKVQSKTSPQNWGTDNPMTKKQVHKPFGGVYDNVIKDSAKVQVIHKTENEDNSEDDEVSEEDYKNFLASMVEIDIETIDDDDLY